MKETGLDWIRSCFDRAAWHYVVDTLPTDGNQLRGALLVIMMETMKHGWKQDAAFKLKRILALVGRLRFLMQLSRSGAAERAAVFDQLNVPKVVDFWIEGHF